MTALSKKLCGEMVIYIILQLIDGALCLSVHWNSYQIHHDKVNMIRASLRTKKPGPERLKNYSFPPHTLHIGFQIIVKFR